MNASMSLRRSALLSVGILLLGATAQPPALAQTKPDAGQLLREAPPPRPAPRKDADALPRIPESRPPLALPSGVKLRVTAVTISGAQTQDLARLYALVADAIGSELDFAGLQALAERISAHYRRAGYLFERAYLPAQDVQQGRIEIAVQEGQLGQLKLDVDPALPKAAVAARLTRLREGEALRSEALEGDLLGLSDLPGVRVQSVLRPGQAVGTSDLDIRVSRGDKLSASLSLDNHGNRFSGEHRVSGRIGVANPLLFGDTLDLSLAYAGAGYRYARLAWQAPVGSSGWEAGLAHSAMDYRLGGVFASLGASGKALDTTVYALKSLQRSRAATLELNLAYDHKRFDDSANSALSAKRADVAALSLSGRSQKATGATAASLALSAGRVQLDAGNAAADAAGHASAGRFAKLSGQFSHEKFLTGGRSLALRLNGQLAHKNLDSSEKLALGGGQAVRAYPQGEHASDEALIASLEARQAFENGWRAKLFADAAHGRAWHRPLASGAGGNGRSLSGVGIGADALLPGQFALQAVLALRTGPRPVSDRDRSPRLWVQLSKNV